MSQNGSPPPPMPSGNATPSANLRQSSLWGRDIQPSGNGGAQGRGRGAAAGTDSDGPRFERLSALNMELTGFRDCDGGESSLFSSHDQKDKPKKKKKERPAEEEDDSDDDDSLDEVLSVLAESEADGGDGVEAPRRSKKKKMGKEPKRPKNGGTNTGNIMAAAAFGGVAFAEDSDGESASAASSVSRIRREAHCQAFPISSVTCVGCALGHRIAPVERFVLENMMRMSEDALFKFAALTYKTSVADPAEREGTVVPPWNWRDLRVHFLMHNADSRIARAMTVRSLQTMRHAAENRLIRNDNGDRELDAKNAELMLKVIGAESRERTLLASAMSSASGTAASGGKGAAMKSTVGDC